MGTTVAPATPGLKRAIGPKLLLLFIVGDILGTGVYALTGAVGARSAAPAGRTAPDGGRSRDEEGRRSAQTALGR